MKQQDLMSAEQKLWIAVVKQAAYDLQENTLARGYFHTEDFRIICEMAGLDFIPTRDAILSKFHPGSKHGRSAAFGRLKAETAAV